MPSMMWVGVPFSKLHEYARLCCFSCWYEGLYYGDVVKFMFVPKLISFVFMFVTIWNIFI